MDPNDYKYLNIFGRTPAQWAQEIAQKQKASVCVSLDKDLRSTPQDPPKFLIQLDFISIDGVVFSGKGVAANKKKAKQIAAIELLNHIGESEETLRKRAFEADAEGVVLKAIKENYIPELKGLCCEMGLGIPKFEVLEIASSANGGIVKMKATIPGRGDLVEELSVTDEGPHNDVQQKIASELLNVLYSQQEKIVQNVIEWANMCEKNTLMLPQEFLNIVFKKSPFPKTPLPRHVVENGTTGNEEEEGFRTPLDESNAGTNSNVTQQNNEEYWPEEEEPEPENVNPFPDEIGNTFNNTPLSLDETAISSQAYSQMLRFVDEKCNNSEKCDVEVIRVCETDEKALIILTFTYENCTASFHGEGSTLNAAINHAAVLAVNFLKDQDLI